MTCDLVLRDVAEDDLPIFFEHQSDPDANYMAAFTAKDPANREGFDAHWRKIMADPTVRIMTILWQDRVVGSVLSYEEAGRPEVSYWIGRKYWGKGIATRALAEFLARGNTKRPIYARVAKDNFASIRVLAKCGFAVIASAKGFANARGCEIEELVLELRHPMPNHQRARVTGAIAFRPVTLADSGIMAALHTESWRSAYRGILPDSYLDGPIAEERANHWQSQLSAEGPSRRLRLLVEVDGTPVGFACGSLGEDSRQGATLENIHVLPSFRARGLGRQLFAGITRWAMAAEPGWPIHLWVYEANHAARRFYDLLEGEITERQFRQAPGGRDLPLLRYLWRDPQRLLNNLTRPSV